MKIFQYICCIVLVASVLLGSKVMAHHSFAMYDGATTLMVEGIVRQWSMRNPHAMLIVEVQAEDGPVIYQFESIGNPPIMIRQGWTGGSIKEGDLVTVRYNPNRSRLPGGGFNANQGHVMILIEGGPEEGIFPLELER